MKKEVQKLAALHASQRNYQTGPHSYEIVDPVSMTIQGQSLTVQELYERHRTGMLANIAKNAVYDNPESFDDIDVTRQPDIDITDITAEIERLEYDRLQRLSTEAIPKGKFLGSDDGADAGGDSVNEPKNSPPVGSV